MKSFVCEFTFDLAANAIASMIWCADAADQCVYVNAALKSYLGRDDSEQLNEFVDHVHPDDRALLADALAPRGVRCNQLLLSIACSAATAPSEHFGRQRSHC